MINEAVRAIVLALFGGVVAAVVAAIVSHRLAVSRDRRSRRDQLQLDLYLEVIQLILKNEVAIAERTNDPALPPVPLQAERIGISHRLEILGSASVQQLYGEYGKLVSASTTNAAAARPPLDDVVRARDLLVKAMARDAAAEPVDRPDQNTLIATVDRTRALQQYGFLMSYLAHENTAHWQRSAFFLAASAAIFTLISEKLFSISGNPAEAKLVAMASALGLGFALIWIASLMAGGFWLDKWHEALRQLEPMAFDGMALFRVNETGSKKWRIRGRYVAWSAAIVVLVLWLLIFGYSVSSVRKAPAATPPPALEVEKDESGKPKESLPQNM